MSGRLKSSVISQGRIFNENQNLHKTKSHERKMLGATDKQKIGGYRILYSACYQ